MSVYTQQERWLEVYTTLEPDKLLLRGFTATEEISKLFEIDLELISTDPAIPGSRLVGHPLTICLRHPDGSYRYFNGMVSRFAYRGTDDRISHYRARIVPWTWFLTKSRDCRIFQNNSVPQIIKKVFERHGIKDYEMGQLVGSHPKWEYCVQYRESDFDFISRLMEQEGIYYYFRHEQKRHVMVLSDSKVGYQQCDEDDVSFADNLSGGDLEDKIIEWEHAYHYQPTYFTHVDYNFEKPSARLAAATRSILKLEGAPKVEVFEWPGEYEEREDGEADARIRIEEAEARHSIVTGKSKCRSFTPGSRFILSRHHSDAESGKQYVITAVRHEARQSGAFTTGQAAAEPDYVNSFSCIPAEVTFRPERRTLKPAVKGVQTATVVGPKGQEIYLDKYGRVKVQFHWDREGKRDHNSSCWIRVAQAAAGPGFGFVVHPRIGHEVVVHFVEGDPDRPLVMGSVYNAEKMPNSSNAGRKTPGPKSVDEAYAMTSLKSQSYGGGGGANEITMNDTAGGEGLFIKAQKDEIHTVNNNREDSVGNDEDRKVGNNRTRNVGVDEEVTIGSNQTIDVGSNRTRSVGSNETVTVKGNSSRSVSGNDSLNVSMNRSKMVMIAENIMVGMVKSIQTGIAHIEVIGAVMAQMIVGKRYTMVVAGDTLLVVGNRSTTVKSDDTHSVTGNESHEVTGNFTVTSSADCILAASKNAGLKAGSMLVIECPDITLKAGGGFIRIDGSGVTISGTKIKLNSGGSPGSLGGGSAAAGGAGGGSGSSGGSGGGGGSGGSGAGGGAGAGGGGAGGAPGASSFASNCDPMGGMMSEIPTGGMGPMGDILGSLSKGELPGLDSILNAVPKELLPPKARAIFDAASQGLAAMGPLSAGDVPVGNRSDSLVAKDETATPNLDAEAGPLPDYVDVRTQDGTVRVPVVAGTDNHFESGPNGDRIVIDPNSGCTPGRLAHETEEASYTRNHPSGSNVQSEISSLSKGERAARADGSDECIQYADASRYERDQLKKGSPHNAQLHEDAADHAAQQAAERRKAEEQQRQREQQRQQELLKRQQEQEARRREAEAEARRRREAQQRRGGDSKSGGGNDLYDTF